MKGAKLALVGLAATMLATGEAASATVYIATQLNGGATTFQTSGATAALWTGTVGDFSIVAASGVVGSPPGLLDSTTLINKALGTPGATLDVWITETDLSSMNTSFTSSFTENVLPAGWTMTESTYASATNSLYGGAPLASAMFSSPGTALWVTGPLPMIGPFSVSHRYHLAATDGGSALSTIALSASAVPEPGAWAMMLGGFALAGAALRRRAARAALAI